jgi:hypothetical protein
MVERLNEQPHFIAHEGDGVGRWSLGHAPDGSPFAEPGEGWTAFQVIGYLPDLVSGGLTGLAKSIIFNYAFEKSTEALGIDPNAAQVLVLGVVCAWASGGIAPGSGQSVGSAVAASTG